MATKFPIRNMVLDSEGKVGDDVGMIIPRGGNGHYAWSASRRSLGLEGRSSSFLSVEPLGPHPGAPTTISLNIPARNPVTTGSPTH
jgi:hypothetical protein